MTSPVVDSLTNIASVLPGEHVACALSPAHDWDRWQNGDIAGTANFAWVEDSPLTYSWTATRGSFLVGEGENAQLQDHADTREAVWVAPADGSGGVATLTCVVDDAAGDRIGDPLTEVGSRNDDALTRTVTVEVVPSYWSAKDKEIGYHPRRDENNQIIEPHQWLPDGRMTAPLDQTVETPKTEKSVAPGELVPCAVELAEDWDTLTTKDGKSISKDDTLTYTWSSGEKGHFLVPDPDGGPPTQAATATGTSATWIAPDDITEDTEVELKCTIDDATGARVTVPVGGSHDDAKVERIAKIKVLVPKVTFEGLARACAGGIGVDSVHSFTITGMAKKSDGTLMPDAEFKLSFENNKGQNKRAKFIPDIQHNQSIVPDTNDEEMKATTDSQGKFNLTVLSSDTITSDVKIKVKRTNTQGQDVDAGEQACDFVGEQSLRRFGIKSFDQGYDSDEGWDFDDLSLQNEGDTTDATVYIKYQKDPDEDIDTNYFLIDGSPKTSIDTGDGQGGGPDGFVDDNEYAAAKVRGRDPFVPAEQQIPLDDDANWLPVAGHHLRVRIAEIVDVDLGSVPSDYFSDYVTLGNDPNQETIIVDVTTDGNGKATAHLTAGPWINYCSSIKLEAVDDDQKSPDGVDTSTGWGN